MINRYVFNTLDPRYTVVTLMDQAIRLFDLSERAYKLAGKYPDNSIQQQILLATANHYITKADHILNIRDN